jgi:hypothetical protein
MSGMAQGARSGPREQIVFAALLIVVGIVGLASQILEPLPDLGGWIVLLIGLTFMGAYAYTQRYAFLVPAGILSGLGAGIVISTSVLLADEQTGGIVVLGLGLGFLSIWVIGAATRAVGNHLWPTIPGGILTAVGAALLIGGQAVDLLDYWGIGAVALGVILLVRTWYVSQRPDQRA